MDGQLTDSNGLDKSYNVTAYFYHENGTLIKSRNLGTFDNQIEFSATVAPVPEYIIFDSPDFWTTEDIQVEYLELTDSGEYRVEYATERSDFPVVPDD